MSQSITGTWNLISFIFQAKDGAFFYPYGENADGVLHYDQKGHMSAIISRNDRPRLSREDFMEIPDEEKIQLSKGFVAYSGTYEVQEDRIVHHVKISFIPNWVGTDLERYFRFSGGNLILSTPPSVLRGKEFTGELTWEKISG